MQTNATHSFFEVSAFNGNRYDGFAVGPSASFARTFTAEEKFIDLDAAGQLFTIITDGAAPKLLKPGPGCAVTAEAKQFLQVRSIDARLAGGKPPHGFEPVGDRTFRAIHDRPSRQRMLVFAPGANIQVSRTQPVAFVPAFIAHKAIGPLELDQILVAGIWIGEPGIELDFRSWEILGNGKVSHGGLLFRWF